MAVPVTEVCACQRCECKVASDKAVKKDGVYYCSKQCAEGHQDYPGCGHEHCACY